MADISTITASNGTTYNIKDSKARGLLPSSPIRIYTSLTGTAAVTSSPYYCARYDVTDSSVTEYTDGMMVSIRVPVAGDGSYGTALQINSLGYKPIVYGVSAMIGTRYDVGAQITAVYNSTRTATLYLNSSSATTVTGCWQVCDYDSNDPNSIARTYYGTPKLSSASAYTLYRMQIVLPLLDGTYVPYSNGNNQPTTYTKTINTTNAFNPFEIIYFFTYNSSSTVAAGGNIFDGYLYYQYSSLFDIRYAMNINSRGTAGTTALTAHQPVYIKAKYNYNTRTAVLVPNASSSNYLEKSSIVQALPSSNPDNALSADETYIYIYIGHAYDKYRIGGVYQKTVYNWDAVNNCIQVFDGNRPEPIVFVSQSSTFSEIYEIKQKGKIPIYKDADGYAFPEQIEDSSPTEFIFTKATDAGVIKWYKVDTADAWTNGTASGGGGGSNLFIANYNTTTYSAISAAKAANKVIICKPVNINEGYALLADFEAPSGGGHGISIYDSGFWWLVLQATTVPTTDISVVLHYSSGDETVTVPANEWGNDGTPNQWSCYSLPKDPYEENLTSVTEVGASPASGSATFSSTKGNKIYTYTVDLNDNWSWSSVTVPSASVNTTVTLSSLGWSETSAGSGIYYQGVTPSSGGSSIDPSEYSIITVSPQGNPSAYANAGIWCDTASYYLLPFYCTSVPTTNIVVNVVLT